MNFLKVYILEHSAMNQKIFQMGLSTETVSLYLLCCGLADAGSVLSRKNFLEIWNGTPEAMDECLLELEERNIISKIISDGKNQHIYQINMADHWV